MRDQRERRLVVAALLVAAAAIGCKGCGGPAVSAASASAAIDQETPSSVEGFADASGGAGGAANDAQGGTGNTGAGLGSTMAVPLALRGDIYFLEPGTNALPDFSTLKPVGAIYATKLDVTPRSFTSGFPASRTVSSGLPSTTAGPFAWTPPGRFDFACFRTTAPS